MPYEYRRMTNKERDEIVQLRKQQGFPFHSPPHPFRKAGMYLISATNYEHTPIMASVARLGEFEILLLTALQSVNADVPGWVILPNHYHFLADIGSFDDLSKMIKRLHGSTSREWNQEDGQTGKRKVWFRFCDQRIRSEVHYYRALNYIHYNPSKHQYVKSPYEWPWSSIHNYFDTYGRDWLRKKWREFPPGNFGKGWDD